uniref:Hedgehog/Intein (Hint) domain-containing protein n=1 Tax=viral metagenome TaxID=1070528 RepID=A0A6C0JFY8_9ZZZZ
MASVFYNVFSNEEIEYLTQLPEVSAAKVKLNSFNPPSTVYFNVPLNEALRTSLTNCFGLDFSNVSEIPMRWIKGDTTPHIDVGSTKFENTYLAYINNSQGEFIIDNMHYPITANTAFKFNEGLLHMTTNTGEVPRLILGPMNELVNPVGVGGIAYYPSEADALASTNLFASVGNYTVGSGGPYGPGSGYTYWRIANNSFGSSPQNVVYANGSVLNADSGSASYYMYPAAPCFLEGSKILALVEGEETYVPIENLRKGDLIKTSCNGYKKVELMGKGGMVNPGNNERLEDRLYKCSPDKYPELTEDLYITGFHSILVDTLTDEQREKTIMHTGRIFVTDNKYRLIACLDERAEPWNSEGNFTIWHVALENTDERMNYGIYANGGLLVESCSINFLKNHTNMNIT